ncbi:hypothetical protein [Spiroplasma ixodetis]|uniref:hypothetical protein n=1 Tax=Spiroplasma ixodetis TaxID=2141 RepID=UPI002578231A|nr:hypothetical protein [Spiroplasma ixodetis]WJG69539.1 hypothetical protein SIXOD_v1c04140 [Spiroplasma ixodetis Y32]
MKLKKLQLITVLLFILTILIIITGLLLLGLFHGKEVVTVKNNHLFKNTKPLIYEYNGFTLWSKYSWYYILTNNNISFNNFGSEYIIHNYYNYSLLQLKIAVIFSTIIVPIFVSIILSLTFLIIGLKRKIKNNNFWDAIANCEIISNYYIH